MKEKVENIASCLPLDSINVYRLIPKNQFEDLSSSFFCVFYPNGRYLELSIDTDSLKKNPKINSKMFYKKKGYYYCKNKQIHAQIFDNDFYTFTMGAYKTRFYNLNSIGDMLTYVGYKTGIYTHGAMSLYEYEKIEIPENWKQYPVDW
ncbi:hypothetical protein D0T60_15120 [Bacteroides sp. 224]|nr:hypothetical protein [Bacteroides sp. 224]